MKALTTKSIRKFKKKSQGRALQMLTCYDFQTARVLSETELDMLLVGDSLGNVVLGYDTTVNVSLEEMKIFGAAVTRGASNKFVVVDMPFGTYNTVEEGLKNATDLFKTTQAQAIKIEGAFPYQLELCERLTQIGIPVVGHIGLTPQSVHQQGGYYTHGKTEASGKLLMESARSLEKAGAFSIVLECVEEALSNSITDALSIPTIGIGSGKNTDGQVLVINDLLGLTEKAPSFCQPIANLSGYKKELIQKYLNEQKN